VTPATSESANPADDNGSGPVLTVEAPAKINLYLHVVGKRDDGYHLLDSLVTFLTVGDTITVAPSDRLALTIDGPFADGLSTGADNLVIRAARELAATAKVPARAEIRLTKRLPVASGIGGGSADAAAALKALSALWDLPMSAAPLDAIGLKLGADVPMCLSSRTAFVGGVGELVDPAPPLPSCWMVLANPGVAVPTPAVFKARSGPFSPPARFADSAQDAERLALLLAERTNDLTAPALALSPVIGDVLAVLRSLPGTLLARMSGSGATCFALFAGEAAARSACEVVRRDRSGWWVACAPVTAAQ